MTRWLVDRFAQIVAGIMLAGAAVSQFVIGPAISPGFTYLAVVLTLAGIGALLAAGLEA
jgi:hypothetical protein